MGRGAASRTCGAMVLAALPGVARAECFVPSGFPNLAEAVKGCPDGDPIVVEGDYQPYRDQPYVVIARDVVIQGVPDAWPEMPNLELRGADVKIARVAFGLPAGDSPTIGSIFASGGSLTLTDVRLEGSDVGKSGVVAVGADVTLERVDARNYAVARAVYADGNGFAVTLSVHQSVFAANLAGAVHAEHADVEIADCVFDANFAPSSPDVYTAGDGEILDVRNTSFTGTIASGEGDVAWGGSIGAVNVDVYLGEGTSFTNTLTAGAGGAVAVFDTSPGADDAGPVLDVAGTTFELTHADLDGGAVYAYGYDVTLGPGTQMLGPSAGGAGGGLRASSGVVKVDRAIFEACDAGLGGAVAVDLGPATFQAVRFADTNALGDGGAVHAGPGSSVQVGDMEVDGAFASGAGGFLFAAPGVDVAVTGGSSLDTVAKKGGGFLRAEASDVAVTDARIERSSSVEGGGALHVADAASVTVERTRFCGVQSATGAAVTLAGRPQGTALISRSVFVGHTGMSAIALAPGGGGTGPVHVWNDDFVAGGVDAEVRLLEAGADLRNLLFVGSDVAVDAQADVTGGYALYDGVAERGTWADEGSIDGEAAFNGTGSGCDADLTLAEGSDAIDAGDPGMDAADGRIDVGAFEAAYEGDPDTDEPEDPPSWLTGGGGGCAHRGGGGIPALGVLLASAAGASFRRRGVGLR